jgi:hypothetical protein
MDSHRRAQGLIDAINRTERQSGPSVAEQDRGDHDVEAIEAALGEETRERRGAALDQHAPKAHLGKARKDLRRWDAPFV